MKVFSVTVKEWFDKVNGNTYFAALGTYCEDGKEDVELQIPYQYGYGSHSEFEMAKLLSKHIDGTEYNGLLSIYCRDIKDIKLFISRYEVKHKELKNWL